MANQLADIMPINPVNPFNRSRTTKKKTTINVKQLRKLITKFNEESVDSIQPSFSSDNIYHTLSGEDTKTMKVMVNQKSERVRSAIERKQQSQKDKTIQYMKSRKRRGHVPVE